jgi:hypothetical protein
MKLLQTMALATAMLVAMVSAGYCNSQNGNTLLDICTDEGNDYESGTNYGSCIGYIEAIGDASQCGKEVNGYSWKSSEGVTVGQLLKVVTKWLNEHPGSLHFGAAGLVANALQDAFPCK